jgi:hypothetical protein
MAGVLLVAKVCAPALPDRQGVYLLHGIVGCCMHLHSCWLRTAECHETLWALLVPDEPTFVLLGLVDLCKIPMPYTLL